MCEICGEGKVKNMIYISDQGEITFYKKCSHCISEFCGDKEMKLNKQVLGLELVGIPEGGICYEQTL